MAHAGYYLGLISGGSAAWRRGDPEQLAVISREYENCIAGLRFAEDARIEPLVLGFNVAMLSFWNVRGPIHAGVRRLEAALDVVGDGPTRGRGYVLGGLAQYGRLLGDHEAASARAREAEGIFAAIEDDVGLATVIGIQGDVAADEGAFDAALRSYERALPHVERGWAGMGPALWHVNVGGIRLRQGDPEGARPDAAASGIRLTFGVCT